MARNADKAAVKKKLRASLDYCNSHHIPTQVLFESIVDETITPSSCPYNASKRSTEMKLLFPVLFQAETEGMIPSIPLPSTSLELDAPDFLRFWFTKWINKFLTEWKSLPSEHIAESKRTVTDRALLYMVMAPMHAGSFERAEEWAAHHNLFMSAENAGGNLLEEYIASKIEAYGWIWCRGKILTAIDFCNASCTAMFQVKNKTNTENSSGKGFRESRGAKVWCRMRAERRGGEIETYWPRLLDIVREGTPEGVDVPDDLMTEEDYLRFVKSVSEKNPDLITEREGNCF